MTEHLSYSMYTLNQFNEIMCKSDSEKYELSTDIIEMLKTLNGLLVDQSQMVDTTPIYKSRIDDYSYKKDAVRYDQSNKRGNKGRRDVPRQNTCSNSSSNSSDWVVLRNFKTTQVDEKQGIEKTLSLIRMTLNKLSNKNYDHPRDAILILIKEIVDASDDDDDDDDDDKSAKLANNNLRYITQSIFDIASTNKFYSDIYATLYKELVDTHGIFRELLTEFINKYVNMFRQILYIDADTDYDQFCEYTKVCDQQKATVAFITNLLKMGVLTAEETFQLIHEFYMYSLESMKMVDRENETEEVVECMSILITQSKAVLKGHGEWADTVVPMCLALASMKGGDYKSLTSRAIFKFKDVMDNISK